MLYNLEYHVLVAGDIFTSSLTVEICHHLTDAAVTKKHSLKQICHKRKHFLNKMTPIFCFFRNQIC